MLSLIFVLRFIASCTLPPVTDHGTTATFLYKDSLTGSNVFIEHYADGDSEKIAYPLQYFVHKLNAKK